MRRNIHIYQDHLGRWRWEYLSRDLQVVTLSRDGFADFSLCWQHAYSCHPDATFTVDPGPPISMDDHAKDEDQW